ncbi:MAG: SPOR domain-containing protein [Deltaproteobacteria bacterium]|nr:SPOR domain-containing protein [Deltaproteobacteria bacterium]
MGKRPLTLLILSLALIPSLLALEPCFHRAQGQDRVYAIHIASYQDPEAAEAHVERLKKLGHNAFYRKEAVKGKGLWYRIYLEKYPTWNEARKEARVYQELGLIGEYAIRALHGESEKPAPEAKDEPNKVYFLHVASFKEQPNAVKKTDALKAAKCKAFFVEEKISGERWYRVYVGRFPSEQAARKRGAELADMGIISYFKPLIIDKDALFSGEGQAREQQPGMDKPEASRTPR